jgi:hypothetical protein
VAEQEDPMVSKSPVPKKGIPVPGPGKSGEVPFPLPKPKKGK